MTNNYVNIRKLLISAVIVVVAVSLENLFLTAWGRTFEAVLVVLVAASFFVGLSELFFLWLTAILFLIWKPVWSPEFLLLAVFPFLSFFANRALAGEKWILNLAFGFLSVVAFYFFLGFAQDASRVILILQDAVFSTAASAAFFWILNDLYRIEGREN